MSPFAVLAQSDLSLVDLDILVAALLTALAVGIPALALLDGACGKLRGAQQQIKRLDDASIRKNRTLRVVRALDLRSGYGLKVGEGGPCVGVLPRVRVCLPSVRAGCVRTRACLCACACVCV